MNVQLEKTVELNYQILKIYEIWHYTETTQYNPATGEGDLFAGYMDALFKKKTEASGLPKNCDTKQAKRSYVTDAEKKGGIKLDYDKI